VEISPLCVLDFYVVEGHQRGGYGRQLFDSMLRSEVVEPQRLGYDRPSPKLIGFLRRSELISLGKFHCFHCFLNGGLVGTTRRWGIF
jgi:hypothetical protein